MSNLPPDLNPYASPAEADGLVKQPVVSTYRLLKDVKQFRSEIHTLGGLWIVLGTLPLGLALILVAEAAVAGFSLDPLLSAGLFAALGLPFFLCGVFTCYKQMWAVYAGLALSYLLGALSLFGLNLCGVLVLAGGIFGGHRIISWSQEPRRKGIPLTTRPCDIQVPLAAHTIFPPE